MLKAEAGTFNESLSVAFGEHTGFTAHRLALPMPLLAGESEERLLSGSGTFAEKGGFHCFQTASHLAGCIFAEIPDSEKLEQRVREIYDFLLGEVTEGFHLYRVWNYIHDINGETKGLENYRIFNRARWQAFEARWGENPASYFPAASAVGLGAPGFACAFIAGRESSVRVENPHQIPSYQYPKDYGPRAPGFARGALTNLGGFLSGTASIRGHETLGRGDLAAQLTATFENMQAVCQEMGLEPEYEQVTCYLRYPKHLTSLQEALEIAGPKVHRPFRILHAEICREDLDVEIEGLVRLGK